jgi:hypothetical protein
MAVLILLSATLFGCSAVPAPEKMAKCSLQVTMVAGAGIMHEMAKGEVSEQRMNEILEKSLREVGCSRSEYEAGLQKMKSDTTYAEAVQKAALQQLSNRKPSAVP